MNHSYPSTATADAPNKTRDPCIKGLNGQRLNLCEKPGWG